MRAVIQRVLSSYVEVDNDIVGKIERGLTVLIGFDNDDSQKDFDYILDKITNLRIFEDSEGKMNLSVKDLDYEILLIPNFTLYADARKGRRPSFSLGASPDKAKNMFDEFVKFAKDNFPKIQTGIFQADMKVNILNDGPITILLDSSKIF